MRRQAPSSDRLWSVFAVASVACLAVLAISPVKDYFREYRGYQQAYRQRLVNAAGSARELRRAQEETVRVRQIWLPELGQVDRCTSCHLGVDDPRMAGAEPPFRSHSDVPHAPSDLRRFGCVGCHRGQGRATTVAAAHGRVADWPRPLLPTTYTEASCGSCHLGDEVPEASLLTAGRRLLRRAGCAACHRIPGFEDWRSTAPGLDGLAEKTQAPWLKAFLRDPRAVRPGTWMPDFDLPEREVDALVAYLWSRPTDTPVAQLGPEVLPAGDYDQGKKIFRTARCISCHTVDGRGNGSAPELIGVASKVTRRWLWAFLANPHELQPRTPMPRYRFDDGQLADLTVYLMEEMHDPEVPGKAEAPGDGDALPDLRLAERGAELFARYGCGGCHEPGAAIGQVGPDLAAIGDLPAELLDFGVRDDLPRSLPHWLVAKVRAPRSFRGGLKMPTYGLDDEQLTAVVTALLSYTGEASAGGTARAAYLRPPPPPGEPPPGPFGELVRQYRCLSCHQLRGLGEDISTAPLTAAGSKLRRHWTEEYLLLPTTIRPALTDRMIPLGMPREEAAFLAEMLDQIYRDDDVPGEIFPNGLPAERVVRGHRLFDERYGCRSCHQADGVGGYYGPPLDEAAGKLKSGWIVYWLQDPQRWRADVRCPDFGLSVDDATDLAAYVLSLGTPAGEESAGGEPGESS